MCSRSAIRFHSSSRCVCLLVGVKRRSREIITPSADCPDSEEEVTCERPVYNYPPLGRELRGLDPGKITQGSLSGPRGRCEWEVSAWSNDGVAIESLYEFDFYSARMRFAVTEPDARTKFTFTGKDFINLSNRDFFVGFDQLESFFSSPNVISGDRFAMRFYRTSVAQV